jgi:hypothetical protein
MPGTAGKNNSSVEHANAFGLDYDLQMYFSADECLKYIYVLGQLESMNFNHCIPSTLRSNSYYYIRLELQC